jgi:hypothetical protein
VYYTQHGLPKYFVNGALKTALGISTSANLPGNPTKRPLDVIGSSRVRCFLSEDKQQA